MANKISVIGSGGWGTALAILLKNKGLDVTLWSWIESESEALRENGENKEFLPGIKLPGGILFTSDISAAADTEMAVLATPSHALSKTAESLGKVIKAGIPIVNVTKGIDSGSLMRFSQVTAEKCPHNPVAVLCGPSHAEEVARGIPTAVVAASQDLKIAEAVQDTFMTPLFRVYTNTDVIGVELGAALKNVIALCAGILDGLSMGDNTKAALMTRGLSEMKRLGVKMGADPATFSGLTGVGDLIVTCTSMHSRNRRAGILIGQGKPVKEALDEVHAVVEGVYATECAYRLAKEFRVEMPITEAAYNVLFLGKSPKDEVYSLMTRGKKHETEGSGVLGI